MITLQILIPDFFLYLKHFIYLFIYLSCVHTYMCGLKCVMVHMQIKGQFAGVGSLFPPRVFWEVNLGHEPRQQVSLLLRHLSDPQVLSVAIWIYNPWWKLSWVTCYHLRSSNVSHILYMLFISSPTPLKEISLTVPISRTAGSTVQFRSNRHINKYLWFPSLLSLLLPHEFSLDCLFIHGFLWTSIMHLFKFMFSSLFKSS